MGSDAERVIEQIRALGPVTAEVRVALRMAAHAVPMQDEHAPRFIGPREREHPWIGAPELADILRVNPSTVHSLCESGAFGSNAFRLHLRKGGTWKVRRSAVEAWMRAQLGGAS
jgi:hypothetical protein